MGHRLLCVGGPGEGRGRGGGANSHGDGDRLTETAVPARLVLSGVVFAFDAKGPFVFARVRL